MIDLNSLDDNALARWFKQFSGKLKDYASTLGLSQSDVQKVDTDTDSFGKVVETVDAARDRRVDASTMRELENYKDTLKKGPSETLRRDFSDAFAPSVAQAAPGVLPRLMDFIEKLKGRSGYTQAIGDSLGINMPMDSLKSQFTDDKSTMSWFGGFIDKLKGYASALEITDSEMHSVENDYNALGNLVTETDKAEHAAVRKPGFDELVKYKDFIKTGPSDKLTRLFPAIAPMAIAAAPGILSRFKGLIQNISGNRNFNDTIGRELGVVEQPRVAAVERETAAARAEATGRRPVSPEPSKRSGWLLPLLLIAAFGLLTWLFWPKGKEVAVQKVPPVSAPHAPKVAKEIPTPAAKAPIGAGPREKVPAAAPLAISDLGSVPGSGSFTTSWKTNKPSTSQIEFGRTESYELGRGPSNVSVETSKLVKDHSIKAAGLRPDSIYHYRVRSIDSTGKEVVSGDRSVTTR